MIGRGKTIVLTTHYLQEADALASRVVVINAGGIVAQGSPAEIKAHVSGKRIRFRSARVNAGDLRSLPGVTRVTGSEASWCLYSVSVEASLAQLFKNKVHLTDLEVGDAALEEAVLALTCSRTGDVA